MRHVLQAPQLNSAGPHSSQVFRGNTRYRGNCFFPKELFSVGQESRFSIAIFLNFRSYFLLIFSRSNYLLTLKHKIYTNFSDNNEAKPRKF